jgi:hypothetical protein
MKKLIFFSLLATACAATGDKLDTFERNEVKRSYTQPEGLKSWTIASKFAAPESSDQEGFAIANPFYWEHPMTDNFTLIWMPLPFGFIYSLANTEKHKAAYDFTFYLIGTTSNIRYKYIINDSWAIEPQLHHHHYNFWVYEEEANTFNIGLIYSPNKNWSIKPYVGSGTVEGDSDFIDEIFSSISGTTVDSTTVFDIVEYGIFTRFFLNRQWDMTFEVSQYRITDYDENSPIYFDLNFIHYWDKKDPKSEIQETPVTTPSQEESTEVPTEEKPAQKTKKKKASQE